MFSFDNTTAYSPPLPEQDLSHSIIQMGHTPEPSFPPTTRMLTSSLKNQNIYKILCPITAVTCRQGCWWGSLLSLIKDLHGEINKCSPLSAAEIRAGECSRQLKVQEPLCAGSVINLGK